MNIVQRLVVAAGVLLAMPALAADLRIPPPLTTPTKASLIPPHSAAPPPPPALPAAPSAPAKPELAKESPAMPAPAPAVAPPPLPAPPARSELPASSPAELPAATPTWLERFGPFLRSQLERIFADEIVTGSITPAKPRCGTGTKATSRTERDPCRAQPPHRRRDRGHEDARHKARH